MLEGNELKIIIEKFLNNQEIRINKWFDGQNWWEINDNRALRKIISIVSSQFLRWVHQAAESSIIILHNNNKTRSSKLQPIAKMLWSSSSIRAKLIEIIKQQHDLHIEWEDSIIGLILDVIERFFRWLLHS